jgi:predicted short-subunit dehydrogenase-like oxidoreductase (DUF2520 family)
MLADMAELIGGVPVRLPEGTKAAYHAAAVLASGGLVALLDAVVKLGAAAGMDEHGAVAVYGRLMEQTLANARAIGVDAAFTGPVTRGDVGTLEAHIEALRRSGARRRRSVRGRALREADIAEERGSLTPDAAERVRSALAKDV